MVVAALYGAGSGALHAVTGPDHLLSLGPIALTRPRAPWRIGLAWGFGHALGTLLLGLPALFLARFVHLPSLSAWGDRMAAITLLATALWSALSLRKRAQPTADAATRDDVRSPVAVGLVHGVSGAASLMLMLPLLVRGDPVSGALFLAAFGLGGMVAMAALTSLLAEVGGKLGARTIAGAQLALVLASALLGVAWLVG